MKTSLLGSVALSALVLAACSSSPSSNGTSHGGAGGVAGAAGAAGFGGLGGAGGLAGAGGQAGAGGSGGFNPAAHDPAPVLQNLGGPVLSTPQAMSITYQDDTNATDIDALINQIGATSYWSDTTKEYGVGQLVAAAPVHLSVQSPATVDNNTIPDLLNQHLSGTNPDWGAPDPNTIYVVTFPATSGGDCCNQYSGYHSEQTINGVTVPYAVACTCPSGSGSGLKDATVTISHELVEATTDPFVQSNPAYLQPDNDHMVWTAATDGEATDLCTLNADANIVLPGLGYTVQRSWSNKAAQAGMNPCVPSTSFEPYFNSVPVLTDSFVLSDGLGNTGTTKGVKIPVGQSKTIDVQLFSDAPTSGPWQVTAQDFNVVVNQGSPNLQLSLDKSSGSNGDVLHLTIKVLNANQKLNGEGFVLTSTLNGQSNVWVGAVGN